MTIETTQSKIIEVDDPVKYVCDNLNVSFSLSASAGCGKTYILIERVVALLRKSIPLESLLLVTFTENAASEMRTKLVERLLEFEQETWAQNALKSIGISSIQTIHSFCLEICSKYFSEASLDAPARVLDSNEFDLMLETSFRRMYNEKCNDPDFVDFFSLCGQLKISQSTFMKLMRSFLSVNGIDDEKIADEEISDKIHELSSSLDSIQNEMTALYDSYEQSFSLPEMDNPKTHANARILKIDQFIRSFSNNRNKIDSAKVLLSREKAITEKRFSIESRGDLEDFEIYVDKLRELEENYSDRVKMLVLETTSELARSFSNRFRKSRFKQGMISYDESIKLASRLLKIESVRVEVAQKYKCILIDEFQDTDDEQIEIVKALVEQNDESDLGKLFVVGDSKQSIYSFRGAQVKSYEKFISESELRQVALEKSYRSVPGILDAVNISMETLIEDYRPMKSNRENIANDFPSVTYLGDSEFSTATQVKDAIGTDIAASILQIVDNKDTSEKKSEIGLNDIAILVRTNAIGNSIIPHLEDLKIPYEIDSSEVIWDLTFTKIVLNFIYAIVDPQEDIAIAGTLKSPVFLCTNDDLLDWISLHKNSGRNKNIWNYKDNLTEHNDHKIADSLKKLFDLHNLSKKLTPLELAKNVIFQSGLYETYSRLKPSEAKNVADFITYIAIKFEETKISSNAHDFALHLRDLRNNKETPIKFIPSDQGDAVKIMTIHKSKGLEFPIVYLVPSHSNNNKTEPFAIKPTDTTETYPIFIRSNLHSQLISDTVREKKSTELEDEKRMLYVGMTRAKNNLILCLHSKSKKESKSTSKPTSVELLKTSLMDNSDTLRVKPHRFSESFNNNLMNTFRKDNVSISPKKSLSPILDILKSTVQKTSIISPSSLDIETNKSVYDSPKISITRERSGNLVGTATHRALNLIDFNSDTAVIENICFSCALDEGIPEKVETIIEMVQKAQSIELIKNSDEQLREVPVSGRVGDYWIEGYIDILVKYSGCWHLIDYKTDLVNDRYTIASKIEKYARQLSTYTFLLQEKHNLKIETTNLLFLYPTEPELIEISNIHIDEADVIKNIEIMQSLLK